jgi:outer membrane protein insertion porin family
LSFGVNVYMETDQYITYSVDVAGAGLTLGREITENIYGSLAYHFERVRLFNIFSSIESAGPPPTPKLGYQPGDYIYDEWKRGPSNTSKVTLAFSRDTTNDPYFPTEGSQIVVSGTVAGLGGNNFFYSAAGSVSWFYPLIGDLVLNLRGNAAFIRPFTSTPVPINERFYVGGIKTMRGFEFGKAGPVDRAGEPIGALNMVVCNAELLYPLSKAIGLRVAVFYDIGKGWGGADLSDPFRSFDNSFTPLRQAVGAGIRWYSPFGPIRVDWGYNLSPQKYRGEKQSVFDFSMGTLF